MSPGVPSICRLHAFDNLERRLPAEMATLLRSQLRGKRDLESVGPALDQVLKDCRPNQRLLDVLKPPIVPPYLAQRSTANKNSGHTKNNNKSDLQTIKKHSATSAKEEQLQAPVTNHNKQPTTANPNYQQGTSNRSQTSPFRKNGHNHPHSSSSKPHGS